MKHKHKWQLAEIKKEAAQGWHIGTLGLFDFAYMWCECGAAKKERVEVPKK